jgi:hypothetical protein
MLQVVIVWKKREKMSVAARNKIAPEMGAWRRKYHEHQRRR